MSCIKEITLNKNASFLAGIFIKKEVGLFFNDLLGNHLFFIFQL